MLTEKGDYNLLRLVIGEYLILSNIWVTLDDRLFFIM